MYQYRILLINTNNRLTDDSDPIVCTTNSATQRRPLPPSSPCEPHQEEHNIVEVVPQATKSGSVLDIENWISSSDEESIDLLSMPAPKRRVKKIIPPSSFSQQLEKRVDDVKVTEPAINLPKQPSKITTKKLIPEFIEDELSDPITSSPKTSQVFTEPASQTKSQKTNQKDEKFSKKDWKEANKATRKKEEILSEMIIELASSVESKLSGTYFDEVFTGTQCRKKTTNIPSISWKRKVKAILNIQKDIFEPCEPRELSEKVIVLFYEADVLIELIQKGSLRVDHDLAVRSARAEEPNIDYYVMVMVTGLKEYLRKLQGIEDRAYRDQMLEKMNEPVSKKRKQEEVVLKASEAQLCIQQAGVDFGLNMFSVRNQHEAIDWLHSFTYTIGSALYDKFQRNASLANIGTVRLGTDQRSTFIEILKKFNLMTQPRAEKLYEFYTSPVAIYKRFLTNDSLGTVKGKNIVPPSANAAMKRVFTATDPSQVIT